jgi:hypothetical protein
MNRVAAKSIRWGVASHREKAACEPAPSFPRETLSASARNKIEAASASVLAQHTHGRRPAGWLMANDSRR